MTEVADQKIDSRRGLDHIGVCAVFFCHDGQGKIVMHKRSQLCRDEQGCWDCGSGSMEFGETFEQAVAREIKEEYNVEPLALEFAGVRNVIRGGQNGQQTHWVAVVFAVQIDPSQLKNNEPHKIEELGWFGLDNLPQPLHSQFLFHLNLAKKFIKP